MTRGEKGSAALRILLKTSTVKAIKSFILNPRQRCKRLVVVLGVALIYVLPILTIPGLAAIYLKIEGIKGDVTTQGYEGTIAVQSAQVGVGRGIGSPTGGQGRETTTPSFSEVTITKVSDSTTPALFLEAVAGTKGKAVDLLFTRTLTTGQEVPYYTITLSDVLVSSFSQSSGGDVPAESISLNYTKIEMIYTPYDAKGTKGTPVRAGYDLTNGAKF
jgi:type VI secretion system secreted protein Hcp